MKNFINTAIFSLSLLSLVFMATPQESYGMARKSDYKNEQVRQGVYGASDAISVGRVDAADQILDSTKKIVPAPKKPLKIEGLDKVTKDNKGKVITRERVVVVPAKIDSNIFVKRDSPEFKELLTAKENERKFLESEKQWKKYADRVEEARRNDEKLIIDQKNTIEKQDKKIKELATYKNIVLGVGGLLLLLIVVYVFSLLIRAFISAARVVS